MCNLYFDGGRRENVATYGFVVKENEETLYKEGGSLNKNLSSNTAEYIGLIKGLEYLVTNGYKTARVYGDSQLILYQIKGIYKVKSKHLLECYLEVKQLINQFDKIEFIWIKRQLNTEADGMTRG